MKLRINTKLTFTEDIVSKCILATAIFLAILRNDMSYKVKKKKKKKNFMKLLIHGRNICIPDLLILMSGATICYFMTFERTASVKNLWH